MEVQKYDIIIMDLHLSLSKDFSKQQSLVLLCKSLDHLSEFDLSTEEKKYLEKALKNEQKSMLINRYSHCIFVVLTSDNLEKIRLSANSLHPQIIKEKIESNTEKFSFDLISNPDLAQTICVTCLGLGIKCNLTGLHTCLLYTSDAADD